MCMGSLESEAVEELRVWEVEERDQCVQEFGHWEVQRRARVGDAGVRFRFLDSLK